MATANRLRELRQARKVVLNVERGMTQAELAEAVGLRRDYIAALELGYFEPPLEAARRLAEFFQLPIEEIWPSGGQPEGPEERASG